MPPILRLLESPRATDVYQTYAQFRRRVAKTAKYPAADNSGERTTSRRNVDEVFKN